MDQTNILVKSVTALKYPKIEFETTDGKKYISDLSFFKKVKCFPSSQEQWDRVFTTEEGYNITWSSRFEINVFQAIDCAIDSALIKKLA
jgi:hypothetical protein